MAGAFAGGAVGAGLCLDNLFYLCLKILLALGASLSKLNTMKKPNAYQRIRAAMKANECWIVSMIRKYGGVPYLGWGAGWSLSIHSAIDRLKARGRIRFSNRNGGTLVLCK